MITFQIACIKGGGGDQFINLFLDNTIVGGVLIFNDQKTKSPLPPCSKLLMTLKHHQWYCSDTLSTQAHSCDIELIPGPTPTPLVWYHYDTQLYTDLHKLYTTITSAKKMWPEKEGDFS